MSTGWTVTLGYNSSYSSKIQTSLEEFFIKHATEVADDTEGLVQEAVATEGLSPLAAREYAQAFADRTDATISIEDGKVFMMASGGNPSRAIKEKIRRAYVRLMMRRMHRYGIEISVVVS